MTKEKKEDDAIKTAGDGEKKKEFGNDNKKRLLMMRNGKEKRRKERKESLWGEILGTKQKSRFLCIVLFFCFTEILLSIKNRLNHDYFLTRSKTGRDDEKED